MATLQRYFEDFHNNIKLLKFEENKILREKRDKILDALRVGLKKRFGDSEDAIPRFDPLNQGSYAMDTGIKPQKEGDFDIDVGLRFKQLPIDDFAPLAVKQWVFDALENHTTKVEIRKPCITVTYISQGEDLYHVDLVVYSDSSSNSDNQTYLARGKPGSKAENKLWEPSDPVGLIDLLGKKFSGEDGGQYKRCIRYLKRWKDVQFSLSGNSAPVGIALTIAAHDWLSVEKKIVDPFANKFEYDDLSALLGLVRAMLGRFLVVSSDEHGNPIRRLKITLPVVPHCDLFEKMSDKQMVAFESKLENLSKCLEEARGKTDPIDACVVLRKLFGNDFPIPDKKDTAEPRARAIVSPGVGA